MASLVLGVGTSHSPMLMLDAAGWVTWADGRDRTMTDLADDTGCVRSFDEWAGLHSDAMATEITPDAMTAKVARCASAMAELSRRIAAANLDALIVVGDDQGEHLGSENLPPFLVYHGATLTNTKAKEVTAAASMLQRVLAGYHEVDADREYPVAHTLAEHVIESLLDDGFDIATSDRLPRPRAEATPSSSSIATCSRPTYRSCRCCSTRTCRPPNRAPAGATSWARHWVPPSAPGLTTPAWASSPPVA
jgi:3-O-methylgallate 3,4-dioxygenase